MKSPAMPVELNTCKLLNCFTILLYGLWCVQRGEPLQNNTECTPSTAGEEQETCYVTVYDSMTYEQAKNYCRQSGLGTLVKLDPFKNITETVKNIARNITELWIGLDDIGEEGKYRWSRDNTRLPSNASSWFRSFNNGTNDCVGLDSRGDFKLMDCNAKHSITCEVNLCANDLCNCYNIFADGVDQFKRGCVVTLATARNFSEQVKFCGRLSEGELRNSSNLFGRAIHLHPWKKTKELVMNQIQTSQSQIQFTWIGLSDKVTEGKITFTSNETNATGPDGFVDFNAVNTEELDCVVMNPQTGLLDYEDCSQLRPFVCQSGGLTQPTEATETSTTEGSKDDLVSTTQRLDATVTSTQKSEDDLVSTTQRLDAATTSTQRSEAGGTPSQLITGLIVTSAVISAIVIVVIVIFCWYHRRQSKSLLMERQNGRIGDGGIAYQATTDIEFLEGTYTSPAAPQESRGVNHGSRQVPDIEINYHLYEDSVSLSNGGGNRRSDLARGMNVYGGNQAKYEDIDSLSDKSERTVTNDLLERTKLIPSPVARSESIQSRKLPNKPDINKKWRTLPKPESHTPSEHEFKGEQKQNYFEIRNRDYDEISTRGNYEDDVTIGGDSHPAEMVYNDLYDSSSPTSNTEMVYNDAYESTDIDNNIEKENSSHIDFNRATDVYDDIDS